MTALGGSLGCDQGSPIAPSWEGPELHVLWTYPPNEAVDVPRTIAISVQFDRFLMPTTAVRQSLCLQAATVGAEHPGTERCEGAGFAPHYDPVDRVATWLVRGALTERTRYNVRLFAPRDDQDQTGVRAFDGAPLAKEYTFAFTTGRGGAGLEPPRTHGFCSVAQLCPLPEGACDGPTPVPTTRSLREFFAASCTGGGSCHGGGDAKGLSGSALRFDDDGKGGGLTAAVERLVNDGIVATETATGNDPAAPARNAFATFGRNMPYIDSTNPGNSYLLYKLILALPPRCPVDPTEESATRDAVACDPSGPFASWRYAGDLYDCSQVAGAVLPRDPLGNCPSDGGFPALPKRAERGALVSPLHPSRVPDDAWLPPAKGEYDRLRQRIRGAGMPHGSLVSRADALAVSAWIADGANVETCPPSDP